MARATSRDALDAWLARDAAGWPETREAWRDVVARAMDVATPDDDDDDARVRERGAAKRL